MADSKVLELEKMIKNQKEVSLSLGREIYRLKYRCADLERRLKNEKARGRIFEKENAALRSIIIHIIKENQAEKEGALEGEKIAKEKTSFAKSE